MYFEISTDIYIYPARIFRYWNRFFSMLKPEKIHGVIIVPGSRTKVQKVWWHCGSLGIEATTRQGILEVGGGWTKIELHAEWFVTFKTVLLARICFCHLRDLQRCENLIWVLVSRIFYFHPYLGKMIQLDEHIFQMGWNHQLVIVQLLSWSLQLEGSAVAEP